MAKPTSTIAKQPAYKWAAFSLFTAIAVILAALGFEHIGGFEPCPLCLQQRYAYYVSIPLLFLSLTFLSAGVHQVAIALLFFCAMLFLANAGLAVYQVGGEWGYWPLTFGCTATSAPLSGGGVTLIEALKHAKVLDCGKPELLILGLSLAGWNVIVCVILTIACLKAAFYTSDPALQRI